MMTTLPHLAKSSVMDIWPRHRRFHTRTDWLESYHSFSFGRHYDPLNTNHGLLVVNNEDRVKVRTGFMMHPHQNMEILTWVLSGELEHKDSMGNRGIIYPGLAQRMSAGTGIWHSEMNPSDHQEVHLLQMWVRPDQEGGSPSYEQLDVNTQLDRGGLVPIVSGRGHPAALSIRQRGAVLWAGRLRPNEAVSLPDAPYVHAFMARGEAELHGVGRLQAGDAVRLFQAGEQTLKANPDIGAEILVWEME